MVENTQEVKLNANQKLEIENFEKSEGREVIHALVVGGWKYEGVDFKAN